jgi:molecular chaperone GrpE
MNNNTEHAALIQQFSDYLKDRENNKPELLQGSVDLFTLFTALTSLSTEVKRETRYVKQALNDFQAVFKTLESSHHLLHQTFELKQQEKEERSANELKPLLFELIDFRTILANAFEQYTQVAFPKKSWWQRKKQNLPSAYIAITHGNQLLLKRLDAILQQQHVYPMDTIGKIFQPEIMQAVHVEQNQSLPSGVVLSECRKGYYWKEKVLRYAEVIVNKWGGHDE